jgi:T5orf172 domain
MAIGPGWVYVLSNEAHPEIQKIGFSTIAPQSRADELQSTGVPFKFVVEFKIYVEECGDLEAAVHQELSGVRINPKREFFRIPAEEAASTITRLALEKSSSAKVTAHIRKDDELPMVVRSRTEKATPLSHVENSSSRLLRTPSGIRVNDYYFQPARQADLSPAPRLRNPNQLILVEISHGASSVNLAWAPLAGSKNER